MMLAAFLAGALLVALMTVGGFVAGLAIGRARGRAERDAELAPRVKRATSVTEQALVAIAACNDARDEAARSIARLGA